MNTTKVAQQFTYIKLTMFTLALTHWFAIKRSCIAGRRYAAAIVRKWTYWKLFSSHALSKPTGKVEISTARFRRHFLHQQLSLCSTQPREGVCLDILQAIASCLNFKVRCLCCWDIRWRKLYIFKNDRHFYVKRCVYGLILVGKKWIKVIQVVNESETVLHASTCCAFLHTIIVGKGSAWERI